MPTTNGPKVEILKDWRMGAMNSLPMLRPSQGVPQMGNPDAIPTKVAKLEVVPNRDLGSAIAMYKRGALSGWGEPLNLSTTVNASIIQSAIRAAERGDTFMMFTLFRDMVAGYTHLQNEFAKRKLTVVGQPHAILPKNKKKPDDIKAAKVIDEMIEHCDNWNDAMDNILDATLWPVSVGEKMFEPVANSDKDDYEFPIRYRLRKIDPVSPTLFCYMIPYLTPGIPDAAISFAAIGDEQVRWNPDDWEPELRFYEVNGSGYPNRSPANTYGPDRNVHVIHRGTNLSKTIRDNFGGHMRAIMFWWFLATQGRDWFGRYMQRWGHPFVVGKVDAQQKDTLAFMQSALSLSMEIGGLVIDKQAEAELMQAASLNGAEGYRLFLEVCNDEVSKVVVGQTLSSSARATGLGSGVAHLHGEVRQDFRQSDMQKLSKTLTMQVFRQYLRINGYKGQVKGIIWGGKDETQASLLAKTMKDFHDSGLEADDEGVEVIGQRVGFGLRRLPIPVDNGSGNGAPKPKRKGETKSKVRALEATMENLTNRVEQFSIQAPSPHVSEMMNRISILENSLPRRKR